MTSPRDSLIAIASLAATAYVLSMLAHEAVGHGGACLALGGRVRVLWALDLGCDLNGVAPAARGWGTRLVAAAGPLVPMLLGASILLRGRRWTASGERGDLSYDASRRIFSWLLGSFLLLPNTGYLTLAASSIGDWPIALRGANAAIRLVVAIGGAILYWASTRELFRQLRTLLGGTREELATRGRRIAWVAYAVSNLLAAGAASRQVGAASTMALSGWLAVVASLAGTSGLLWGVIALRRGGTPPVDAMPDIPPRWPIVLAGVAASIAFMAILGRGLHIGA